MNYTVPQHSSTTTLASSGHFHWYYCREKHLRLNQVTTTVDWEVFILYKNYPWWSPDNKQTQTPSDVSLANKPLAVPWKEVLVY